MVSKKNWRVANAVAMILLWMFFGTTVFWYIEGNWTIIDSFYFAVTSLTTVGYGDLTPSSQFGRLVASLYILFGVGIVLASMSFIGSEFLKREEVKISRKYVRETHKQEHEVNSEIESVKNILKKNTKELREQAEIIEATSAKNQRLKEKLKELKYAESSKQSSNNSKKSKK